MTAINTIAQSALFPAQKRKEDPSGKTKGLLNQEVLSEDGKKDSFEMSAEAKELSDKFADENAKYMEFLAAMRDLEASKSQKEAAEKIADDVSKVMIVMRRMAKGDSVPPKDEKKLLEYSSEMYEMAKHMQAAARMMEKKHKKYKSLWEDEEEADKKNSPDTDQNNEISSVRKNESYFGNTKGSAPGEASAGSDIPDTSDLSIEGAING